MTRRMTGWSVLLVLALVALLLGAAPVVAAPTVDFSVMGAFGGGADLGGCLGFRIIEKPPDAQLGGLWADGGVIAGEGLYLGLSTEAGPVSTWTAGIVKRVGAGYSFEANEWRLVVLKTLF